ncbi:MAG: catalase [Anaerovorax sp.]
MSEFNGIRFNLSVNWKILTVVPADLDTPAYNNFYPCHIYCNRIQYKGAMSMKIDIELIQELARLRSESQLSHTAEKKEMMVSGEFTLYLPMYELTEAKFLQNIDVKTPVLLNFARMTEIKSNADSLRDMRRVGLKFYTEDGEWDLICSSLPSFFIDKSEKLPALVKSLKPTLEHELSNYASFWRFIADNPESIHTLLWLFSDRGTIKSYRHMEFFSVNTYVMTNGKGKKHFVRYKFSPISGVKTITRQEAEFLAGFDPNVACRDLHSKLEEEEVHYEMSVQIIGEEEVEKYDFNILDVSKLWPEKSIPSMKIGKLSLKKIQPVYYDKISFNPTHMVNGIEFSETEMLYLLGFLMKRFDTKLCREKAGETVIWKSCESLWTRDDNANPYNVYLQAGTFYEGLSDLQKNHLIENILDSMMFVEEEIQEKIVSHFMKTHKEFGTIIEKGLNF